MTLELIEDFTSNRVPFKDATNAYDSYSLVIDFNGDGIMSNLRDNFKSADKDQRSRDESNLDVANFDQAPTDQKQTGGEETMRKREGTKAQELKDKRWREKTRGIFDTVKHKTNILTPDTVQDPK